MNLAPAPTGDHVICYRIQQESGQIKLRLWEPPATHTASCAGQLPYLYAANFKFRTRREAETFLHHHLLNNGAFDVPEANFPENGQIAILPFATWSLEPSCTKSGIDSPEG